MAYTTIKKPSDYFNTKLYTGDGNSSQAITGVGFQPDLVWLKNRSDSTWHQLIDAVRGTGSANTLASNSNEGDGGGATNLYGFISAIGSDGFTVSAGTSNASVVNHSGNNYASWNWLASNTTASNTDGSITSTVSANTTSGFSIVSYTGTGSSMSVGHGLSQKPDIVIFKNRDAVVNWGVYTDLIDGSYDFLYLNQTNAKADSGSYSASANTFSFSASSTVANTSGEKVIAYCFHNVKGYSKIGTYIGNGNADGTFVYTGFKPAFLMIKCFDNARSWVMWDTKRNPYNLSTYGLLADTSDTENSGYDVDLLSNGFKLRTTGSGENGSGFNYIYMAFAEEPLVGDNPATAR